MNITVHTVCFNEALMLPHFLNYYSKIAEKIYIYDNYSTDDSVQIASDHPNTIVTRFDSGGEHSELTLMNLRNNCWKNDQSDYSIVCDMDEFLYHPSLLEFLQTNISKFSAFKPIGYEMVSEYFPDNYKSLITEQVKRGCESIFYSKMILFKPTECAEINFGPGSHTADPKAKNSIDQVKVYSATNSADDLKLLHYKNLGFEYRRNRHNMYAARLGEDFRNHRFGFHYTLDLATQEQEFNEIKNASTSIIT